MPTHVRVAALVAVVAAVLVAGGIGSSPAAAQYTPEQTVAVVVTDTPFAAVADPMVAKEGIIRFEVTNGGAFLPHNMVFVATDLPPDGLPVDLGYVVEEELYVIGKTEQLLVGESETIDLYLEAGNHVLFCNDTAGHYDAGEYTGFTVVEDPTGDADGDKILNGDDPNDDNDACTDAQEMGDDPVVGGLRHKQNFWDVFDVPAGAGLTRDGNVTAQDIFAVISRFNATDSGPGDFDRNSDPLSIPNQAVLGEHRANYHPAFDRGPLVGPYVWHLGPPDGSITALEIFAVIAQFGHGCA